MKKDVKDKILHALKTSGRLPTSTIGHLVGYNYHRIKTKLAQLEEEGLIEKDQETLAVYWKLKPRRKK